MKDFETFKQIVLNGQWKNIKTYQPIDKIRWSSDHDGFIMNEVGSTIEYVHDYGEFYEYYVDINTKCHWTSHPTTSEAQHTKEISGWLTLLNGMSLLDIHEDRKRANLNESVCLSLYVRDRTEDAFFSISTNTPLPWGICASEVEVSDVTPILRSD